MNQKHNVTAEKLGIQISSGTLAGLAGGAVTISKGETSLFVSATAAATLRPGQDFFPLTVDYREKFTAAGRFPGGYFKREGRPSEKEILTSRLCDRPLRPLFPKGFLNEVQVIGYLLSTDQVNEADVLMVNGASAALMISDIPWDGPVGCVRLGEIDGEFVVNPTNEQMYDSTLDLIYVGSEKEMMMIEGSADQIPEDRFVAARVCPRGHSGHYRGTAPIGRALRQAKEGIRTVQGARRSPCPLPRDHRKPHGRGDLRPFQAGTPGSGRRHQGRSNRSLRRKIRRGIRSRPRKMAFEIIQEEVYRDNILQKGKRRWTRAFRRR